MVVRSGARRRGPTRPQWQGRGCWWAGWLVATALMAVLGSVRAQLHVNGEQGPIPEVAVLQEDGQATDFVVITTALRKQELVQGFELNSFDSQIVTNNEIATFVDLERQYANFTITLEFDGRVGITPFQFVVRTSRGNVFTISGSYRVAGISFIDSDNNLVSGKTSNFEVGNYLRQLQGPHILTTLIVPFDASMTPEEIIADATVSFDSSLGVYQREIAYPSTCTLPNASDRNELTPGCGIGFTPTGARLVMQLSPYRVGYGQFFVRMNFPSIADPDTGATLDQLLSVLVETTPLPPPAIYGTTILADYYGGEEHPVLGFNAAEPPRSTSDILNAGTLTLVGSGTQWTVQATRTINELEDRVASEPDQVVYAATVPQPSGFATFDVTVEIEFAQSGAVGAEIVKDSAGGPAKIEVKYQSSELAVQSLSNVSEAVTNNETVDILDVYLQMDQYDPSTYSAFKRGQTCESLLGSVESNNTDECVLSTLAEPDVFLAAENASSTARQNTDGLVARYRVIVGSAEVSAKAEKIQESVASGQLAKDLNVNPSTIRLFEGRVPAPPTQSPTPSPTPEPRERDAQLQGWVIALIAILTAIAFVAVVACCLFVLYKQDDDEETEGEFLPSDDVVAVIPRPDDALYQQAIVRDAYGRGELNETAFREGELETEDGIPAEYPQVNS